MFNHKLLDSGITVHETSLKTLEVDSEQVSIDKKKKKRKIKKLKKRQPTTDRNEIKNEMHNSFDGSISSI